MARKLDARGLGQTPLRAFVGGATGFTGRAVVAGLAQRGIEPWAHVRPDSPRLEEWRRRFEALGAKVDATPWDAAAMAATMKRLAPTLVFSLLGTTRHRMKAERGADYESVDYGLSAILLKAAIASGQRPRFVYLSSAGVGPRSANAYFKVRWRFERELMACGLPYTIARPSFIVGPDRDPPRPGERLGASAIDAALGLAGLVGLGKWRDRYRSTTSRILAAALIKAALDPAMAGAILESEALRG